MSKRDFRRRTALELAESKNCAEVAGLIREAISALRPHKKIEFDKNVSLNKSK